MIVKPREKPLHLLKLEALDGRLAGDHPMKELVNQHLSNRMAGYKGEQSIDYFLSFLGEKEYHIFHSLRLYDGTNFFQIDTLLASYRHILILEVKRIAGILQFEPEFNQFIRITEDNKMEPYADPIVQAERQKFQLIKWLRKNNTFDIPVETLVVSTSPKAVLQSLSHDKTVQEKVIHKETLPFKIAELGARHSVNLLNEPQLLKLSRSLLHSHTPLNTDILNLYKILKNEIRTGVRCPDCSHLPMVRERGKWRCSACKRTNKTAHLQALKDYSLLIGPQITNKEAREFLHIPSQPAAKRILKEACADCKGEKRRRVYLI
ncbi:NERD domain-containing protein [Bacillus salacetis]|uniref:NERD domain-containing protein n=1 Tax=Bacillus salacetis TaxID=2315464 RepID=A0A3A1QZL8_9BACI|nr:nuclease-related domain-containing protein [Bacillus salacetis]RIW31331.1 NERD domain-containing protein [Bacillus salacetis]